MPISEEVLLRNLYTLYILFILPKEYLINRKVQAVRKLRMALLPQEIDISFFTPPRVFQVSSLGAATSHLVEECRWVFSMLLQFICDLLLWKGVYVSSNIVLAYSGDIASLYPNCVITSKTRIYNPLAHIHVRATHQKDLKITYLKYFNRIRIHQSILSHRPRKEAILTESFQKQTICLIVHSDK